MQLRLVIGADSIFSRENEACSTELAGSKGIFLDEPYFVLHHFSQAYWKAFPPTSSCDEHGAFFVELSTSSIALIKGTSEVLACDVCRILSANSAD